jgi:uncharacterized protein (DUF433 family)
MMPEFKLGGYTRRTPMHENGGAVTTDAIDWSKCPLIEVKAAIQSGAPVLRGTRMPVSAIVDNFDYGLTIGEIAEQFEVPPDRIEAILSYANTHRLAHPV